MNFNIDSAIFISFLVFNLAVGLFYSRGIKNIKEYAIGNRGVDFFGLLLMVNYVAIWRLIFILTIKELLSY